MSRAAAELRLRTKLARALNVRAEGLRSEIYGTLERNRVGSGTFYPGNRNPSSLPGDPPARQSGRLMESIAVLKRASTTSLSSEVGPRPESFRTEPYYPYWLEFGNRRIAPRPFMRPSLELFKRKVRAGDRLPIAAD